MKVAGKKAGFIPGAGDKVPDALQKMGYAVTTLRQKDLTAANLKGFDVIVTGVRAYNIYEWLNDSYEVLMNYVKEGGVLLVQYNTNNNIGPVKAKIGPYPFTHQRNRVTDETAAVKFLQPKNSLMTYPNKISEKDFDNWIQERSTSRQLTLKRIISRYLQCMMPVNRIKTEALFMQIMAKEDLYIPVSFSSGNCLRAFRERTGYLRI